MNQSLLPSGVVGGVDTHKDLHVAAVVDAHDRIIGSQSFPSTRQGYNSMLKWMQSLGTVERVGVECTGTYGAGLLRHLQKAGITVLEYSKSPLRTKQTVVNVGKTIPLMQKTQHMQPLLVFAQSHRKRVME